MLTKEEREEIAERFRNYDKAEYVTLYSGMYDGLLGEHVPKETTVKKDRMELASHILELCDTSNMLELPVDKDGEVIRIHDVVYDNTGMEREVSEFRFPFYGACIYARTDDDRSAFRPDEITHKKPVTIASLVSKIRNLLTTEDISDELSDKIWELTDLVEMSGDNND